MSYREYTSGPSIDRITSDRRRHIINLHNIPETIERTHPYGDDYMLKSLEESETALRRLRNFIQN